MPSHQARRDPLPSNYQFGNGPQEPYWAFLSPRAYSVLLSFIEPHLCRLERLVAAGPCPTPPLRRSFYLKGVLYIEGKV